VRTFVRSAGLPTADDMERLRGLDRVRPL
jgi:hypothetical protein